MLQVERVFKLEIPKISEHLATAKGEKGKEGYEAGDNPTGRVPLLVKVNQFDETDIQVTVSPKLAELGITAKDVVDCYNDAVVSAVKSQDNLKEVKAVVPATVTAEQTSDATLRTAYIQEATEKLQAIASKTFRPEISNRQAGAVLDAQLLSAQTRLQNGETLSAEEMQRIIAAMVSLRK